MNGTYAQNREAFINRLRVSGLGDFYSPRSPLIDELDQNRPSNQTPTLGLPENQRQEQLQQCSNLIRRISEAFNHRLEPSAFDASDMLMISQVDMWTSQLFQVPPLVEHK